MFFDSDDSSHSSHNSPTFHQGYPISDMDPRYFDARRSPSPIEPPGPPPFRPRRPSFDHSASSKSSPYGRTVRFNEDPVLPDPPPRRKGWWNRRGDQLWNNDGAYRPAPEHGAYPPDLRGYPEPGVGWMNEEGVQIDTKRRLVRRKLKPALKKAATY
ncbi:hypothetical protein M422DRAFT_37823 [Sphaerobolus stellatus SS14]|uniref:Uncharacterized protein n=1 Tax=Sphaerobolus stellatus (strain SS14) TaxID=990650 RepID=A0A0C9UEA1_SPHS4|nr:hypothetical protein M422DRAFT_37823 [Sphaerobolus stellatus SS14]